MFPHRADEHAAMVFVDIASSLDAGLPIESMGGDPGLGDNVLFGLCASRGAACAPTAPTLSQARC